MIFLERNSLERDIAESTSNSFHALAAVNDDIFFGLLVFAGKWFGFGGVNFSFGDLAQTFVTGEAVGLIVSAAVFVGEESHRIASASTFLAAE